MASPFEHLEPVIHRLGPPLGQARREVLFLHGAWHGPWCWEGLTEPLAHAGYGLNLLELAGHGQPPWPLPAFTSVGDYADLARRAAAKLERPVLVGHSLGGWLAQKVLEVADLPAVFLAALPGGGLPLGALLRLVWDFPGPLAGLLLGRPLALGHHGMAHRLLLTQAHEKQALAHWRRLCPEPFRVALEMGLGVKWAKPPRGRMPRLVVAGGQDYFLSVAGQRRLARRLGARLEILPDRPHHLWLGDSQGTVAGLLLDFLAACPPGPGGL